MEIIPYWFWFVAGLGLLIVELNTATFFFGTVGFGALVASLADFFLPGEIGSFVVFVVGTGLAAYLAWKFDIYSSSKETLRTGADRLIEEIGTVEEVVDPSTGDGIVLVNGEKWRAESAEEVKINAGNKVVVVDIEGTSLVVREIEGGSSEKGETSEEG
ncbi:MAG: NfeD family protein [Candidatus Bipolaricaulota bacterium]|nr:NfeD family protein [Candidatus Bipolaricaulota bacterium]MBS3792189.1 NfeD family protein [Candidatus Bipolaricaulota bacterium]